MAAGIAKRLECADEILLLISISSKQDQEQEQEQAADLD